MSIPAMCEGRMHAGWLGVGAGGRVVALTLLSSLGTS